MTKSANRTLLMIGDVTGESGIAALESQLGGLCAEFDASVAVVNGENAADGFGMTESAAERIFAAGADVISSGNHIWEKREFLPYMQRNARVLRPANYPDTSMPTAGSGICSIEKDGMHWVVMNLQGREFMMPIDCPLRAFDRLFASLETSPLPTVVAVDFHAESEREKETLAFYVAGRAACVAGTHTHVQTADERILPGGTAYITDLGMTGARDGIIGMNSEICLDRARTQILHKLECASGPGSVQGAAITFDAHTAKPVSIRRFSRQQV